VIETWCARVRIVTQTSDISRISSGSNTRTFKRFSYAFFARGCMALYACFIIIISLLKFPLLGHRLSLRITHKVNGPKPITRAQCGLMGDNDCKVTRDQRLNVSPTINGLTCLPKNGGGRDNIYLVTHPMTDQRCLTSAIARRNALIAGPSSSSLYASLNRYKCYKLFSGHVQQ
jgi:hypothetical protein